MNRLLSMTANEILSSTRQEFLDSIKFSEGRVVMAESIVTRTPYNLNLTGAEAAAAFGADMILLNLFDMNEPKIEGLDNFTNISDLEKFIGRPIGVNLEPVDKVIAHKDGIIKIPEGRKATRENFILANELGFRFVCLTGNPGSGVSNSSVLDTVGLAKEAFNGFIIVGKMHAAGVNEDFLDERIIREYCINGAHAILLPAPYTVPGVSIRKLEKAIDIAKQYKVLTVAAIGTSQETSSREVIRQIALASKALGFDIHHIGDSGCGGIADVMNIMELSNSIRGMRHTVNRVSQSILR